MSKKKDVELTNTINEAEEIDATLQEIRDSVHLDDMRDAKDIDEIAANKKVREEEAIAKEMHMQNIKPADVRKAGEKLKGELPTLSSTEARALLDARETIKKKSGVIAELKKTFSMKNMLPSSVYNAAKKFTGGKGGRQ